MDKIIRGYPQISPSKKPNILYSNYSKSQGLNWYEVRKGWIEYFQSIINDYSWDLYLSLTFVNPVGRWALERSWRGFIRHLRWVLGHRVEWFRIVEWQRRRIPQVPHIHSVMLNCNDLYRMSAKAYWDAYNGYARIMPYDVKSAGLLGEYLSKDFAKDFIKYGSEIAYYECSRGLKKYNNKDFLMKFPQFSLFDIEVKEVRKMRRLIRAVT